MGWTERKSTVTSLIECQKQATYPTIYYFFLVVLKITLSGTTSCTDYSVIPCINFPYTYVSINYMQYTVDFVCAGYTVCKSPVHDSKLLLTNEKVGNNAISCRVLEKILKTKKNSRTIYLKNERQLCTYFVLNK